jgi:ethanolamine utilization protein EutA (predicted chaperonin)
VQGTFTPKLSNMLGTQAVAAAGRRPHLDGVIGAGAHLLKEQDHSVQ